MDLTGEETERYLYRIFSGKHKIYIDNKLIEFRQPDLDVQQDSNLVYDNTLKDALDNGMLSLKDLEKLIIEKGLFTEEDEDRLSRLRDQLEAQDVLLSKVIRVKGKPERVKGIIAHLEKEILELKYKKSSKLLLSAENKASDDRILYACSKCSYYDDGNLVWSNYKEVLSETNLTFKNEVLLAFLRFYNGVDSKIVRYLARSSLWRIRYVSACKTGDSLFSVSTSDYTNDQLNLVYWSNFYQNVYDMMPDDRPSDLVIEDDDALDSYMKSYYEERQREDASRRQKQTHGKLSAFDKEEVIITKSNDLYEDMTYDKPREARRVKDRVDLKKRAVHRSR